MEPLYDMIVIGGGPGGYSAALYAARAGLQVLLLEQLSPGGQMGLTDTIDNYPGFPQGVSGFELAQKMKEGAERFHAVTKLTKVVRVRLSQEEKEVVTAQGVYRGKTVVLACGARPRTLELPKEDGLTGRGVSYCATCDGMFYRRKTVAVVGGGNTAAADALYLKNLCEKVYLIHRRDSLRASRVYWEPLRKAENLEMIWDSQVTALFGEEKLSGIAIKNKKTGKEASLSCDGLFVAIGTLPNTELVREQLKLDEAGYISADETTRTEIPGVFAVGDLRRKPLRQVVTAASDGAVAAHFAEEYLATR